MEKNPRGKGSNSKSRSSEEGWVSAPENPWNPDNLPSRFSDWSSDFPEAYPTNNDAQPSQPPAPVCPWNPDNLPSRFSDCSSDFLEEGEEPVQDGDEDGDQDGDQDSEAPRLLSEAENDRLNRKIDALISALTSGRQVHFEQDPVTGNIDFSAGNYEQDSDPDYSAFDAAIAAYPENFGRIIRHRREMIRSPNSISRSWITIDSPPCTEYATWEDMVAVAVERYDREHGISNEPEDSLPSSSSHHMAEGDAPAEKGIGIRQATRRLEQEVGVPRGRFLARVKSDDVILEELVPLPLNFNKPPRVSTPSIHSEGSRLDCSSPLFMHSWQRMPHNSEVWIDRSTSTRAALVGRISQWLNRVETPEQVETPKEEKRKGRQFGVYQAIPKAQKELGTPAGPTQEKNVLKDVSNLRQSGYLQKNSFAMDKAQSRPLMATMLGDVPPQGFEGAWDEDGRRAFINRKWPCLLETKEKTVPKAKNEAAEALRNRGVNLRANSPQLALSADPERKAHLDLALARLEGRYRSPEPFVPDPQRATHFETALARLEGRAPAPQSSPIQRYVYPHGVYGPDVEVDLQRVRCYAPRARRNAVGNQNLADALMKCFE